MACFLVPTTEAIVTTIVSKTIKTDTKENPFLKRLPILNKMLWGGSALLAFEHVWHGEVVPFFPFLTAAANANDAVEMLHEMSTVGVTMAILTTAVWVGIVLVANAIEKRSKNKIQSSATA